jgi:transcriptional repressor NrdR
MKCPYCGALDNKVIDSRLSSGGEVTRRRRECDGCQRRYTTYERVEEALPLVVKKDDRREPFDRGKLREGLRRACEKRPVSTGALEKVLDDIERDLIELGEREVRSNQIGERVMVRLRELDPVAYVRFASVYRRFEDIGEFLEELRRMAPPHGAPSKPSSSAPPPSVSPSSRPEPSPASANPSSRPGHPHES